MDKTIVINFFGGPGTGKSTQAAFLFAHLKVAGISCELVTEYAKDMTWQESFNVLTNQLYIFAKQAHRHWRVTGKVKVIITDSPLIQNLAYAPADISPHYKPLVIDELNKYDNINILLKRSTVFDPVGRNQTLTQCLILDAKIDDLLKDNHQPVDMQITLDDNTPTEIFSRMLHLIKLKTDEEYREAFHQKSRDIISRNREWNEMG